jgi:hypothetical protein
MTFSAQMYHLINLGNPVQNTVDKNNNINTKVTPLLQLYPLWLQTVSKIWCSPNALTSTPHQ